MKFKVNDNVLVTTGKYKGKSGKIMRLLKKSDKVVVEGVNMRTKHVKKTATSPGQRVQYEAPFEASNVMVICPKTKKPTRIGYKTTEKGKKYRIAKCSGAELDATFARREVKKK